MNKDRDLATTDDSDPVPSIQTGSPTVLLLYCAGSPILKPLQQAILPGSTVTIPPGVGGSAWATSAGAGSAVAVVEVARAAWNEE